MKRLLLLLAFPPLLGGGIAEGNRLYREGQFRRAEAVYRRRLADGDTSAALRYDLGTALLRLGRWDDARPHLEAAAETRVAALRQRAHYNAGNADLEPVFRRRVTGDEQRRERLERAIRHYKEALLLRPGDMDAKWNLELALRLLRREPPRQGGGGGGNESSPSSGGGGAQQPQPAPQPSPSQQPRPELSEREAERILTGAAGAEKEAQRQVLKRARADRRPTRDW
ncbi:MAG TPA: tetratricopeptide repeat protein [Longimicrobium sp.]